MKKRVLAVLVAVFMLSACQAEKTDVEVREEPEAPVVEKTETVKEEVDYKTAYDAILDEYYDVIKMVAETGEFVEDKQGISENASYLGNEALSKIGYAYEDVNNDGIEELLIGMEEEFSTSKNTLFNVYTLIESKPHLVLDGRSRDSFSLLDGGTFYNYGSNGAAYSLFGEYKLGADGELETVDFYFSYERGSDMDDIGFYHNQTGIYEREEAEELNITDEEFWEKTAEYEQRTKRVMFTPFADLKKAQDKTSAVAESSQTDIYGVWECNMRALDMNLVLRVELSSDGTASYDVGEQGSEWLSENRGRWTSNLKAGTITLDLAEIQGGSFYGEYKFSVDGSQLSMQHISGNPFIYGEDGKTFVFNRK